MIQTDENNIIINKEYIKRMLNKIDLKHYLSIKKSSYRNKIAFKGFTKSFKICKEFRFKISIGVDNYGNIFCNHNINFVG